MKPTIEQFMNSIDNLTKTGLLFLLGLAICLAIYITFRKLKRKYILTLVLVALASVLWIGMPNINIRENINHIYYVFATLGISCFAIPFVIAEICTLILNVIKKIKGFRYED